MAGKIQNLNIHVVFPNRGRTEEKTCIPFVKEDNHEKARAGRGHETKWKIPIQDCENLIDAC